MHLLEVIRRTFIRSSDKAIPTGKQGPVTASSVKTVIDSMYTGTVLYFQNKSASTGFLGGKAGGLGLGPELRAPLNLSTAFSAVAVFVGIVFECVLAPVKTPEEKPGTGAMGSRRAIDKVQ